MPGSWTLRQRLVVAIVLLVTATSTVIGMASVVLLQQNLLQRLDQDVRASSASLKSLEGIRGGPVRDSVIVFVGDDGTEFGAVSEGFEATATELTPAQIEAVAAIPRAGSGTTPFDAPVATVDLGGAIGEYRVTAVDNASLTTTGESGVAIVGYSTAEINTTLSQLVFIVFAVTIIGILVAAIAAAVAVRTALRPLQRVASVATEVAGMRLDRGTVDLAKRVPERDTDPGTEVGQVGAALNNLLDTVGSALVARQASEDKVRHFVADASHELRTPLASIRGYAELTRRDRHALPEPVQHSLGRIESEATRMTSLVEDLLLLARLDSQRELDRTELDLSLMLVDVISDAHAAGPDHRWLLDLPEEPVVVLGDRPRLQQVFVNLLANARVHTPAGTEVTMTLAPPADGVVVVRVRDTGPGITSELLPTLFERFVRGDASRTRATGSTGLGLSIVHAVVEAHHGSVEVTSEPGATEFAVRLPATP